MKKWTNFRAVIFTESDCPCLAKLLPLIIEFCYSHLWTFWTMGLKLHGADIHLGSLVLPGNNTRTGILPLVWNYHLETLRKWRNTENESVRYNWLKISDKNSWCKTVVLLGSSTITIKKKSFLSCSGSRKMYQIFMAVNYFVIIIKKTKAKTWSRKEIVLACQCMYINNYFAVKVDYISIVCVWI